jgi:predicted fused transcriptional regulator/phosphomethylpyrimidine kinase
MALSYARDLSEVAGIPGRIVKVQDKVKAVMEPNYGVSRHVAATVLTGYEVRSKCKSRYEHKNG